jgi:Kinesin motor domain
MGRSSVAGKKRRASALTRSELTDEEHLESLLEPVPESSNHMRVAVRIRPLSKEELASGKTACCSVVNGNTVVISKGAAHGSYLRSQQGQVNEYTFDCAFDSEATQAEVYEETAKPYICDVLDGLNVTVFAYGATGMHQHLNGICAMCVCIVFVTQDRRTIIGLGSLRVTSVAALSATLHGVNVGMHSLEHCFDDS